MKFLGFNILTYKKIVFGDFTARQFILFEHKRLFTLLFFYFRGEGWQDRYHTHAFNALSVKFFGSYLETSLLDFEGFTVVKPRTEVFKYFPRNSFHKLGFSKGCMTMLLADPWEPEWQELVDGENKVKTLKWGRK